MEKKYLEKLRECKLMKDIDDIETFIKCFNAKILSYNDKEEIVGYGDKAKIIIILEGTALTIDEDYFGNRNIISTLHESGIFGAAFLYAEHEITTRLVACGKTVVLSLEGTKLLNACDKACYCHIKFLRNTVALISNNCVEYLEKAQHLSRRTVRDKILSYLKSYAIKCENNSFDLPYSRQELADYLAIDRCVLSSELSKLQNMGIIKYHLSHFTLNPNKANI